MKQEFWVFSFIYSIDIYSTPFSEGGFVSTAFILYLSLSLSLIFRQTVMQNEG